MIELSREKELIKNTFVLSLGKFLPKFVSIITLPIVTAQLTKSEYGTYDLISTLIMLVMPIATLQIQSAAFRFLIDFRGDDRNSSRIITNIFAITIPISVIVAIIIGFLMPLSDSVRIVVAFYFIADVLYLTVSQIARGLAMNKEYSISSILLSIVNGLGIIITLAIMDKGLFGVVFSLCLANIFSLIYLSFCTHIFDYLHIIMISTNTIKEMIAYSWPMIPNNLSTWILSLSDRLVITAALGVEANAVYAVANKIPNMLSLAQSVFVMAWQENASLVVHDKDAASYYTKMFDTIFSLMFSFTALLIGFTPVMFYVLIRGDYDDAYYQIPLLILGMFFYCMSAFQGGIYIAHKKTKNVGITTVFAALINFIIDILLVNIIGITAGSLSTLIAYFLLYIYRIFDSLKFQEMHYNAKKQIKLLVILLLMLILCYQRNLYLNIVNIGLSLFVFVYTNMEYIKAIYMKLITNNRRPN